MNHESRALAAVRVIELGREEYLALLAGIPMGRIGFAQRALPVIRPVNHVVDGGSLALRTHPGSPLWSTSAPVRSWSTRPAASTRMPGPAGASWSPAPPPRSTPLDVAPYRHLLTPWVERDTDHVVRITAELVTGYRLAR